MNVVAFRHFYNYHFAQNRQLLDDYVAQLSAEQFVQAVDYSLGSVRNQLVHIISVDQAWFSGLRGVEFLEMLDPNQFPDLATLRAYWANIEATMREYLANLQDADLQTKPLDGEDENLIVWQVLLQVVNHGTDHRAQILRLCHDFGIKTSSQDYIFYVYEHPEA
ncbi:MAG: DinB family protein [Chloroflexi bacterium]|nr:DinB family protein [Chloroflexota bacterium]